MGFVKGQSAPMLVVADAFAPLAHVLVDGGYEVVDRPAVVIGVAGAGRAVRACEQQGGIAPR